MKKVKVGIIGCGTIGGELAKRVASNAFPFLSLAYISDISLESALKRKKELKLTARVLLTSELIQKADLIIEAASGRDAFSIAAQALAEDKDILVMSVGGLLVDFPKIEALEKRSKGTLYIPSGAICGIDGILAASERALKKVTLTTSKPIKGLIGAPYFAKKGIDIAKIKKETIVFDGTAREAIRYFPQNINVAAVLSLAGLGVKKTRVRILTSPTLRTNSHEISAEGAFGRLVARTENVPSPTNPKTSYMAILAAEAVLRKYSAGIKIGS
jgi:aspartate dehydrogenase